jgi:hypothetical protein
MDHKRLQLASRVGFGARIVAVAIGFPIYLSLLPTLPALAAVLAMVLYLGVPVAARRAVMDPVYHVPGA